MFELPVKQFFTFKVYIITFFANKQPAIIIIIKKTN